jgi:hypothetical protein
MSSQSSTPAVRRPTLCCSHLFVHYLHLRFDAFLPSPEAPSPPSLAESAYRLDLEFYNALGPERSDMSCASQYANVAPSNKVFTAEFITSR